MFKSIELIVYDFDGVMTDNRVFVFQDGMEAVRCSRADGLGIDIIRDMGIPQIIISTESNNVVKARADKVKLDILYNVKDKKKILMDHCAKHGYDLDKVIFIGNDVNDLQAMQTVGFPVCPSDAHEKIKEISKFVLMNKGGEGVIRELADMLGRD